MLTFTGERDHGCEIIDSVKLQYPNASKSVLEKAKYEYTISQHKLVRV